MKEAGDLDGELAAADFEDAKRKTPPSVSPDDLSAYAQWDAEFGSR